MKLLLVSNTGKLSRHEEVPAWNKFVGKIIEVVAPIHPRH